MVDAHRIALADLAPGDLLFFEADDDAVSQEVVRLDRSRFSHVGIVVDTDRSLFASARPGGGPRRLDPGGGVQIDPIAGFSERKLWVARPAPTAPGRADPAVAAQVAQDHVDRRGFGGDQTDFSLVKLVLVALALHVFDPARSHDARLHAEVMAAARAWTVAGSDATKDLEVETFYCAEFIAHVYGATFTVADFPPPPSAGTAEGDIIPFEVEDGFGPLWAQQILSFAELVGGMFLIDPEFVERCGADVIDLVKAKGPHPIRAMAHTWHELQEAVRSHLGGPSDEPTLPSPLGSEVVTATTPLPPALVTPRILETAPWIEWCRPLDVGLT